MIVSESITMTFEGNGVLVVIQRLDAHSHVVNS
jgi:hypothetical protein